MDKNELASFTFDFIGILRFEWINLTSLHNIHTGLSEKRFYHYLNFREKLKLR